MSRFMRLYYYAVLGAIGGLIAWQVSNLLGLSFTRSLYLNEVIAGALIGFCIGALIGAVEGVLTQNVPLAARSALISALLGTLGGAIGLPIAEGMFQFLGGQAWSRAIGWGIFGLLIGAAGGIKGGAQVWKSALGGLIGGIMGGLLLEASRAWWSNALAGKAAGMLLLGACVGVFIALIVYVLARAWFEVTSGKLKGTEFILDKFLHKGGPTAFIGSSSLKADIVLPDPEIAPQHALLKGADTHFNLKDLSMGGTFVNGRKIEESALSNAQTIQMGHTQMVYHEKR